MTSNVPLDPRAVLDKARDVIARVRPGPLEARRSLPVRQSAEDLRHLWSDENARAAVFEAIPVADASLDIGPELEDWGTAVTLDVVLEAPVPGMAAQALAGRAVRRLKALAETGEVPSTDRNPSARSDAGEEAR